MEQLAGKVAVVTGGASGIGRAVAERAAAEGMKVVLADIEEATLKTTADAMAEAGADVVGVVTDVASGASVEALRDRALSAFGAIHLVHNNAGVAAGGPVWTIPEQDWTWVLGVNLWGVIHGIRAFVPLLVDQGEGHVVNTASLAGLISAPMLGPYTVTKHGVVAISETLIKDLRMAGSTVGVSVLCPGFVKTGIADSERNRPDWAPAAHLDETGLAMREMLRQIVAAGIAATTVAERVLDAVKTNRFYILTHDGSEAGVRTRLEDIIEGRPPSDTMIP